MNIYDRIKAELHRVADYNGDGKINHADIEGVVASIKLRVGTGWKSYLITWGAGVAIGAFAMWVS
jgi:hypothetical protein